MVLLTVLWTIALLSALAMAASVSFRGFAGVAAVERDQLQGDALLTAGLEMAAGAVAGRGDAPLTEREITVDLSTGSVRADFSDEGGRIDIGKAPPVVVAALLRSVGASEQEAEGVAQRIAEWRRSVGKPAGAGTGAGTGPPNDAAQQPNAQQPNAQQPNAQQPFADVREVAEISGMAPAWLSAIRPLTTVFGSDTVNPLTAPAGVIAALPGVDRVQVAAFLAARRTFPTDAERLAAMFGAARPYLVAKPQQVVSVELVAALRDGYAAAAHAVIVLLPQDSQPYRVIVWKPLPSAVSS